MRWLPSMATSSNSSRVRLPVSSYSLIAGSIGEANPSGLSLIGWAPAPCRSCCASSLAWAWSARASRRSVARCSTFAIVSRSCSTFLG
ncbi:MAG: hypothetical protein DRI90_24100 [Deltaproteobacteria bacterium]|nr:MAG: hypothetical protein DRI90_24100 [Deltaproteobacteria bacterium]